MSHPDLIILQAELELQSQFVFSLLNKLPKESHDVDFSRIKPWYLDGRWELLFSVFYRLASCAEGYFLLLRAAYLRQSILLSAYETPETRALFNHSLQNVAGKIRFERRWQSVAVPEGLNQVRIVVSSSWDSCWCSIIQNFVQFDCGSPKDEAEKRFSYFTTQVPKIMKDRRW